MTLAEYERLRAGYAARGEYPIICCQIDDLPAGLAGILYDLFGIGGPEAEPELGAAP
jgi:hypothetical protein